MRVEEGEQEETTESQEEGTEDAKSVMERGPCRDWERRDMAGQVGPSVTAPVHPLTSLCDEGRRHGGTRAVNGGGQESRDRTLVAALLQWRHGAVPPSRLAAHRKGGREGGHRGSWYLEVRVREKESRLLRPVPSQNRRVWGEAACQAQTCWI